MSQADYSQDLTARVRLDMAYKLMGRCKDGWISRAGCPSLADEVTEDRENLPKSRIRHSVIRRACTVGVVDLSASESIDISLVEASASRCKDAHGVWEVSNELIIPLAHLTPGL